MEESEYIKGLNEPACIRYCQKMHTNIGYDPYQMKKSEFSQHLTDLPGVEAIDITNYLVIQTPYYTASQMKAYKSLEAYNYFVCSWVHDLGTKEALSNCRLVFAQVRNISLCYFSSNQYNMYMDASVASCLLLADYSYYFLHRFTISRGLVKRS